MSATVVAMTARRAGEPAAAAWFVPGVEPRQWLDELLRLGCADERTQLLIVPTSRQDRRPCGVLVVPPGAVRPDSASRALPYACRVGRLFHPCEAELWPPVQDHELTALLATEFAVFHPVAGLVGFERGDVLGAVDLFACGPQVAERWDLAEAGVASTSRLRRIEPEEVPAIATMFAVEQREIGGQPPTELPRSARERRNGLRVELGRAIVRWLARLVLRLTRRVPHTGSRRTWINGLEDWAAAHNGDPRSDQQARDVAVMRLLALLREDPARGLEYALPLGGAQGRGIAPPANVLGPRQVDFDLQRLGGGSPLDAWHVAAHQQRQLAMRYRELANAEIAAGRRRRAAYIFAHLLGDLRSAAMTLRDGGFAREAAVLFRDHLRDFGEAADCLVKAGLLGDAAALYEQCELFEHAGDLRLVLRHTEAAAQLHRRAMQQRLARRDPLGAALLQVEKLGEVDPGLALLEQSWRDGLQASHCLAAQLALLARLQRDGELGRVLRACTAAGTPHWRSEAARVIAQASARWADGPLRDLARDCVRRAASELLPGAEPALRERLLAAIVGPRCSDQLLVRDARRYASGQPARRQPVAGAIGLRLEVLQTIPLPTACRWTAACSSVDRLIIAGVPPPGATGPNGGGDDECRIASWSWHTPEAPVQVTGLGLQVRSRGLSLFGDASRVVLGFQPRHGAGMRCEVLAGDVPVAAAAPPCWPDAVLGAALDDEASFWCVSRSDDGLLLTRIDVTGELRGTYPLPALLASEPSIPLPMAAMRGHVVIGIGSQIVVRLPSGELHVVDIGFSVCSMAPSPRFSRPRIAIGLELGYVLLELMPSNHRLLRRHAVDWHRPAVGIQDGGRIIAIGDGAGRVHAMIDGQLQWGPESGFAHERPFAVLPGLDAAHALVVGPTAFHVVRLSSEQQ
jgi:hypothetical protein